MALRISCFQWVGDGAGHARGDGHGDKGRVEQLAIGHAEADVAGAADGVAAQFLADHAHHGEEVCAGGVTAPTGMASGSTITSSAFDAVAFGALDDLLGHLKAHHGIVADARSRRC